MQQEVKFIFAIGERVSINSNQLAGTVIGQWNGRDGDRYSVEYTDRSGAIFERWFRGDEIAIA